MSKSNKLLAGVLLVGEMDNARGLFKLDHLNERDSIENNVFVTHNTGIFKYDYTWDDRYITIRCHKPSSHFLNDRNLGPGGTILGLEYNCCMLVEIKDYNSSILTLKTLNWLLQNKLTK